MMSAVANSPAYPFATTPPEAPPRVAPRLDRYSLTGWAILALGLIAAIHRGHRTVDISSLVRAMNFILPAYFLTIMPYVGYLLERGVGARVCQSREDGPDRLKLCTNRTV